MELFYFKLIVKIQLSAPLQEFWIEKRTLKYTQVAQNQVCCSALKLAYYFSTSALSFHLAISFANISLTLQFWDKIKITLSL